MALSKEIKEYLDSLSDDDLKIILWLRFGEIIPKWKECSKKEYEKHYGKVGDSSWPAFEKRITCDINYKAEPIYDTPYPGILFRMNHNNKPIGYKYFKQVGEERVLMLGSDMIKYCKSRECMKDMF